MKKYKNNKKPKTFKYKRVKKSKDTKDIIEYDKYEEFGNTYEPETNSRTQYFNEGNIRYSRGEGYGNVIQPEKVSLSKCFKAINNNKDLYNQGIEFTDNAIIFNDYDESYEKIFAFYSIVIAIGLAVFLLYIRTTIRYYLIINNLNTVDVAIFVFFFIHVFFIIFKMFLFKFIIKKIVKFYKIIDFKKNIAYSRIDSFIYTKNYDLIHLEDIIAVANNTVIDKTRFSRPGRYFSPSKDYRYVRYDIYGTNYYPSTHTLCFLVKKGWFAKIINFYTLKYHDYCSTLHGSSELATQISAILNNFQYTELKTLEKSTPSFDTEMKIMKDGSSYTLKEVDFEEQFQNNNGFLTQIKILFKVFMIFIAFIISIFIYTIFIALLMGMP